MKTVKKENGGGGEKAEIRWKDSIQTRQIIGFTVIILFMIVSSTCLQWSAMELAAHTTYEKMMTNASYFLESLESELSYILQLQANFFNDRRLPFLECEDDEISAYERRDALLSVQERLQTLAGASDLVEEGLLSISGPNYWITPSRISRMTEENRDTLEKYLGCESGTLHYDAANFFVTQAGLSLGEKNRLPRHSLVIIFSGRKIQEDMRLMMETLDAGSFFCNTEEGYFLSANGNPELEHKIYEKLEKDAEGEYLDIQRLRIDGEWYLVCVGGHGMLGLFVQYTREKPIMRDIYIFRTAMFFIIFLLILMAVFFVLYMKKLIHLPIHILMGAFEKVKNGNWKEHIIHNGKDEFGYLYDGFNDMEDQLNILVEKVYIQTNLAQKAQMKQLQAQINPHFLYNSFFVLNTRIKREDYDNAQALAVHLGKYFRFLTRNDSDDILLEKEVEHAESYVAIQAARFSSRITIEMEVLPEAYRKIQVPRLILQPLFENAFEYGLEERSERGLLCMSYEEREEEFLIVIEDNGKTAGDEDIERMREALLQEGTETTGLVNIHYRLQIYFHKKAGLRIDRSPLGGVRVTVYIERRRNESKSADC